MAKRESKETDKTKKKGHGEITFRCANCQKDKQLAEMRTITRFFPVLVVCRDCEKLIH